MKTPARWLSHTSLGVTLLVVVCLHYIFYRGLAIYAVDLARTTGIREFCTLIDYYGECKAYNIYPWLFSRLLWSEQVRFVLVVLAVISVFALTRRIYGSPCIAFVSALLFLSTPSILAGIRDDHGLYYTSMLLPVAFVLLYSGADKGLKSIVTLGGLVLYTLLLFHPVNFVLTLALSVLIIHATIQGLDISRMVKVLYVIVILNLVVLALHVFDIVGYVNFSLASVIIASLSIGLSRYLRGVVRMSYVAIAVLGYAGLSALLVIFEQVYLNEIALKFFDPVKLWGLTGILCLPGVFLAIRRKASLAERYLATLVLALAPLTLFKVYVTPLFTTITSTLTSELLKEFYALIRGWKPQLTLQLARLTSVGTIIATVLSAYVGSGLIVSELCLYNTPFEDVTLLTRDRIILVHFYEQLLKVEEELSTLLVGNVTGKVLVLALPTNAYWIAGILSRHETSVQLISTPYSSTSSQALLAKILTSEEDTAVLMLKDITSTLKVSDVYIIIVFPYSERLADGSVYVGIPREARLPGLRYPVLVFEALGDIASIPWLLQQANKTIGDYLQILANAELERAQPLFWTVKGSRILLIQLVLKSFEGKGIKARNYNIGFEPDIILRYFDPVYVKNLEVVTINTVYYGAYRVYYMVSVFRLKGDVVGNA